MINSKSLSDIFDQYQKIHSDKRIEKKVEELFQAEESCTARKNFFGHITASAILADKSLTRILLIHHKFLNRFLQPGGHIEESDQTTRGASERELREETGIEDFIYLPIDTGNTELPMDIDVHEIPANAKKNEPEHLHFDLRYLFVLNGIEKIKPDLSEVHDAKWFSLEDVARIDDGFLRIVEKSRKIFEERGGMF